MFGSNPPQKGVKNLQTYPPRLRRSLPRLLEVNIFSNYVSYLGVSSPGTTAKLEKNSCYFSFKRFHCLLARRQGLHKRL